MRAQAGTGVPQNEILHTDHIGALLFDEMFAFAQQIPHGPLSFGIEVSFG
jgi:hypothetical protein